MRGVFGPCDGNHTNNRRQNLALLHRHCHDLFHSPRCPFMTMARALKSHVRGKPVLSLSKGSHAWFGVARERSTAPATTTWAAHTISNSIECKADLTPMGFSRIMSSRLDRDQELGMNGKVRNHIKEHRLRHGLSQEELANAVGVSRQSINSIERGRYTPSLPLALRFAQLFGCATDELFQLEEEVKKWK